MLQMWGHFILSDQVFLRIEMIFCTEDNPWQAIHSNRDAFRCWRIISGGEFLQMRMIYSTENNPWQDISSKKDACATENNPWSDISLSRDAFLCWKASLARHSCEQRWFPDKQASLTTVVPEKSDNNKERLRGRLLKTDCEAFLLPHFIYEDNLRRAASLHRWQPCGKRERPCQWYLRRRWDVTDGSDRRDRSHRRWSDSSTR